MDTGPTRALRERSPELLRTSLEQMLRRGDAQWLLDRRDLAVALAPYHDCARRLGLDPQAVFDAAAEAAPPELHEFIRSFGRRSDVTPTAFGFAVLSTPDGPRYEWR